MSRHAAHLHLAASFEQHWHSALGPWFARACAESWRSSLPTVALVPSRAHGYFLRSRLLENGLSFAGIYFFTAADVRSFLISQFQPEPIIATRENLHLLVSAAAEAHTDEPMAATVAHEPEGFLRVIENIETAGGDFSHLPPLQKLARDFRKSISEAGLQMVHESDRALLRLAQEKPPVISSLLVLGFSAAHWPLWTILRAASHAAKNATICLGQLRTIFSEPDEAWIGSWEEIFGAAEQAPTSEPEPPLVNFAEAFEAGTTAERSHRVFFRVGANTSEQAKSIISQAIAWLSEDRCGRLGIVFPSYGALSREVGALLESRGIPHNDSLGHLRPGIFETKAWAAWLALQENPRVGAFIRFARACSAKVISPLHAGEVEEILRDAFHQTLINDLAVLAGFLERDQTAEKKRAIAEFVKSIELLPDRAPLAQFNESVSRIFEKFEWKAQAKEIARQATQLRKFTHPISRRAFLRWLGEIMDSFQRVRDENGGHPYAKVHLVSYDQAHGQRWSHLILTSLNEGAWPPRPVESGYLSERQIDELNARIIAHNKRITRQGSQGEGHITVAEGKAFCLGPRQQRWAAQRQFIDLIESTEVALCATASLTDENDPARRLKPGEFFNRLFFVDRGTPLSDREMDVLHEQTRRQIAATEIFAPEPIDENKTVPMLRAFKARRDQTQAFGEFEFALKTPLAEPVTITCTDWDRVVRAPAAIWMKYFTGVEAPIYEEADEPWIRTIGTWAHNWLAQIAPAPSELSPFPAPEKFLSAVRDAANRTRADVELLVAQTNRKLPAWWFSVWSQAAYFAGSLARIIGTVEGWSQVASEYRLKPPVPVSVNGGGTFRVHGRIDLLLAEQSNVAWDGASFTRRRLWVVDYKTGGSDLMKLSDLEKGKGFQLALYALALRQLGASEVAMSIIKPNEPPAPQLNLSELDRFDRVWEELCRMQESGVFGANGDMRAEFGAGAVYPLATLEIDADVLAEKWNQTHRGFVREEEDDAA